jgi:outer membrane receptor protein involved in Fe transport
MNSLHSRTLKQSQKNRAENLPFRYSAMVLALAGITMLTPNMVYAADDKAYAELQAEVARINAENANLKKQLEARSTTAATPQASAPAEQAAATVGAVVAAEDDPIALDAVVIHSRSRNRIERLQDVPVSESVVSGKELASLGATGIAAITQRAGNVAWNQGNQRTSSLSIRGIGKQGQTEAQDPGVGLIVDGVSYAYGALANSYDFTDIDTVEVARGPQGTLLGKNSSYGAVVVNTVRPSFTPSSNYSLTVGQRGTVQGTAALGGAIVDDLLAWRGSLSASKAQGPLNSLTNADNTYTNTDRLTGRAQFLLTPSSDFNALIAINGTPRSGEFTNQYTINTPLPATYTNGVKTAGIASDISTRLNRNWFTNQGYVPGSVINSNTIPALNARPLVTGSNGASAQLNWNLAGGHTLTSITAVENYYFDAVNDSGIPYDVWRNAGGFKNNYKQMSEEVRLSSPVGGFVDYQTGLYMIDVRNINDYQKVWGNDAGAYLASNAQYTSLNANAAGQRLMQNSLAGLSMHWNSPAGQQDIKNKSEALFGQANWHFTDQATLTTGLRFTQEDRNNTGSSSIVNNGAGAALNPVSVNGVQLGGFSSNATSGALTGTNNAAQTALANQVALQYFGVATYAGLTAAQLTQVAQAKALRAAQIGVVFAPTAAQPYSALLPSFVISPSYKFNDHATAYVSLQYGQKAGVAQFTNGISNPVRPEKTISYEAGIKSILLDDTLVLNTAVFLMDVKDYQQSMSVLDTYKTALNADGTNYYTTATGNVPKVQANGVEIDGVYTGLNNIKVRFSGAYNHAIYKDFTQSAQPAESAVSSLPAYRNVTGMTLPGASKWTGNIGVDYKKPVFGNQVFHTTFNTAFRSGYNSDVALSSYSWIGGSVSTDISIGLGRKDQSFDGSFIIKNLFNNHAYQGLTWNSYTPGIPRWVGVMFTAKM